MFITMELVYIILSCFIVGVCIYVFEDVIIQKNFMWKKYFVEGEILWFDECALFRRTSNIAVIQYTKNNMLQKVVVRRGIKDKIGDRIRIATNGNIAVRVKPYWKKDLKVCELALNIIVIVLLGRYIIVNYNKCNMRCILLAFCVTVFAILIYPLLYELDTNNIKRDLGWH